MTPLVIERSWSGERPSLGIASALRGTRDREGVWRGLSIAAAALLHVSLGAMAGRLPRDARPEAPRVSEVELAPPPVPVPVPVPVPDPPTTPEPAPAPAATARSLEPQVARAGNVVTAKADAPPAGEDVADFVTDPAGTSFGSGVVARGGTLDRASTPVRVAPRPGGPVVREGPAPTAPAITPPENLSRAARLEETNPCAGSYPVGATVDAGLVTIALVVTPSGQVASSSVVDESPRGEGFGAAARACLAPKTLAPALDKQGRPTTAALTLRVRFTR